MKRNSAFLDERIKSHTCFLTDGDSLVWWIGSTCPITGVFRYTWGVWERHPSVMALLHYHTVVMSLREPDLNRRIFFFRL